MEVLGVSISYFVALYYNKLFAERNSSWLIYESIYEFEIRTSIVFNWYFPNNTIVSCSFLVFYIIDLYFLIPAVIAQIFIPTAELIIPTGIAIDEANAKIQLQPVIE